VAQWPLVIRAINVRYIEDNFNVCRTPFIMQIYANSPSTHVDRPNIIHDVSSSILDNTKSERTVAKL
jgi:hypothetical protein